MFKRICMYSKNFSKNLTYFKFSWIFLGFLFFSSACKTPQAGFKKPLKEKSTRFLLKKLKQQQQDFEWLRAKAKLKFENSTEKRRVRTTIYLRKDSLIWFNIKKLGVEAFRIQITPDSIYIINRLEKNYMIKPLSFIESKFKLAVNFKSLQAIFLGNPIFLSNPKEMEAEIKEDQYYLSGQREALQNEYFLEGEDYLLTKMNFMDFSNDRSVSIEQGTYKDGDKYENFSYFRSIKINSAEAKTTTIDLKFTRITINTPKKIRFEIPSHYTRIY